MILHSIGSNLRGAGKSWTFQDRRPADGLSGTDTGDRGRANRNAEQALELDHVKIVIGCSHWNDAIIVWDSGAGFDRVEGARGYTTYTTLGPVRLLARRRYTATTAYLIRLRPVRTVRTHSRSSSPGYQVQVYRTP